VLTQFIRDVITPTVEKRIEALVPQPDKTKRQTICIKYKGQMLVIKGKAAWRGVGPAKLALRNALEYWVGYDLFARSLDWKTFTLTATGDVMDKYQHAAMLDEICQYMYTLVTFEPIQ